MEIILAILIGLLYTAGAYMVLRRSLIKFIVGLLFLSNATNLFVFVSSGIVAGKPAFVDSLNNVNEMADPVPQALVLTAIVIGFGLVFFTLALKYKFYKRTGSDDIDKLIRTE